MKQTALFFFSFLLLIACQKQFIVKEVQFDQTHFDSSYSKQDPQIEEMITPYRATLDEQMNKTIVYAKKDMEKGQPEGALGNILADASKIMAEQYTDEKIDVGIMNHGGIRVPGISKGPLTLGNVYEIMPFDNYLVVLAIDGKTLHSVCQMMIKKGGWPISGMEIILSDASGIAQIRVNGERINENQVYKVAISDYLANGGDDMSMLKGIPQTNTNILLRDAFIAYFTQIHQSGQQLDGQIEGRISYE